MKVSIEWLKLRAYEELSNIKSKQISRIEYIFSSREKIRQNEIDAAKSLAKIQMINEILEKFNKDKLNNQ